jgi:hypothetical protein
MTSVTDRDELPKLQPVRPKAASQMSSLDWNLRGPRDGSVAERVDRDLAVSRALRLFRFFRTYDESRHIAITRMTVRHAVQGKTALARSLLGLALPVASYFFDKQD